MAKTWQWGNPFSSSRRGSSYTSPEYNADHQQQQHPAATPKSDIREVWGHKFNWTPLHLSPEQLHPLKFTYDVLADECLNRLDAISPPSHPGTIPRNSERVGGCCGGKTENEKGNEKKSAKRDLYALLKDNADKDEKLAELWREVTTVPEWVDWEQIERGQEIFYRYGGPALTAVSLSHSPSHTRPIF